MSRRWPPMDTKVAIQSPPDPNVPTTGGVVSSTWTTETTLFASIEPLAGGEITLGDQAVGVQRYRVIIRWPGFDILPTQRLVPQHGMYSGSLFYIDASGGAGSRLDRRIEIICREGR